MKSAANANTQFNNSHTQNSAGRLYKCYRETELSGELVNFSMIRLTHKIKKQI